MPDTNPTVRPATAERGVEDGAELEAAETNALIALHAFGSHSTPASREIAMRAVETFVDTMRDAAFPSEQVVITIKAVARRAGVLGEVDLTQRHSLTEQDLVVEEFISAAVRRFFRLRIQE